jgi:hypothetical protein
VAVAAAAPAKKDAAPRTAPAGTPKLQLHVGPRHPEAAASEPLDNDETVIISAATPPTVVKSREFVPAAVDAPALSSAPQAAGIDAMIDRPMSAQEKNVAQRFEVLKRLLDEGLITPDEYARHRNANIGAMLPYTHEPPSVGLERPSASADAVVARLQALGRALEMRAITAQQHAEERAMILAALLPALPDERAEAMPPPADVIQGTAMISHLKVLQAHGLISSDEFEAERKAIDQYMRTGSYKPPVAVAEAKSAATATKATGAKKDEEGDAKTASAAKEKEAAESDVDSTEPTGPVLHLASFRTEEAAKRAWQEALGQNRTLLGPYHEIIRKVDLGEGKGVFYRLMAGPFASLNQAEAMCIKLKANNQFCRPSADGS